MDAHGKIVDIRQTAEALAATRAASSPDGTTDKFIEENDKMPVLVIAEVKGQTLEGYEGMLAVLGDALRRAEGFVLHTAHPVENGWRIVEIWETKDDADRFFAECVAPNLPPGIRPKRSVQLLHGMVRC